MQIETITWREGSGWSDAIPRPDHRSTLITAFGRPRVALADDAPLHELWQAWPDAAIVGCSTAGTILGTTLAPDDLVVTFVRFERTVVRAHHVELARHGGARRCGRRLAEALAAPDLAGIFVLCDGFEVNGTSLARGFSDVLPDTPVGGGLAADDQRFRSTWTVVDGEARSGWISAVSFVGRDVELGFGSATGWHAVGPDRLITRSHGNVLYELDGRPALDVYREYLGDDASGLPSIAMLFPLCVRDLDGREVVRTVIDVGDSDQSIAFAGDVPQGSVAQLMWASAETLVDGAYLAGKEATLGDEELAIAISCAGRRMALRGRAIDELDSVAEALAPGTSIVGLYSFGELSPTDEGCDLHNQTMTVITLAER